MQFAYNRHISTPRRLWALEAKAKAIIVHFCSMLVELLVQRCAAIVDCIVNDPARQPGGMYRKPIWTLSTKL